MKSNFLSKGQLFEKNFKVFIEDEMMRVLGSSGKLILRSPISHNRTFKIKLNVIENMYLETATNMDEFLWNYRLDHLNFKDINNLKRGNTISGLPEINIPNEVCEECV